MVAPVYNFDPKILPEGSAKLRWAGRVAGDLIYHSLCGPWKEKKHAGGLSWNLKGSILFLESPLRGRPEFDTFY